MSSNQELLDLLAFSKASDNVLNISQQEVNLEFNRSNDNVILPPINQDPRIKNSETEYKEEESLDDNIKNKNEIEKAKKIKEEKPKKKEIKKETKKKSISKEDNSKLELIKELKEQIEMEKNKYLEEIKKLN